MRILTCKDSTVHGKGLFTVDPIQSGDIIGRFEGYPTTAEEEHVLWYEEAGKWLGLAVTNILKYANHATSPNVELDGFDMIALTDIPAGSELVFHYGEDWI